MGDLEAVGDAVTGAMLARAVEPEAGDTGHTHEGACLNCGTRLVGPFCAVCGQKSHVHRSLKGFFQDFVAGLFNFEGKFWRTLPMLAWMPGELTRRYIAGERARFISPIALYLFTVFLTFAVLNLTGALGGEKPSVVGSSLDVAAKEQKADIAKLEKFRAQQAKAGKPVANLDRKIASDKHDLAQLEKVRRGDIAIEGDMQRDSPQWLRNAVRKAQKNPELVVTNMQDAASKFSWLLIPLSVPFLWLLFPFRRRHNLYDHAVFVTYSLSFMMMLVIAAGLLVAAGASSIAGFLFFVPPFHMYRQLKGAYELSRFGTWWRTILLTTFAFIAGGLFFLVVAAVGMS
ncbi:DUF3667 domain-containing protein [Sphingomonas hankyongi]|uniref:DUF3667 domain-containing protein n=1 Tax=Sphingomonas hankyongi TaxID=2908209 RepID=A0ABT0S269_9SPHN|nr:DUF3667 domain-containing protein [Sphingomonas hankyongi]MCL6729916.1 DUF3667 domain-containing protein [Sphingomonas hankyongi]